MVSPGDSPDLSLEKLPSVQWSVADLVALGRVANVTTLTILDLCSQTPDHHVSLTQVVDAAGIPRNNARGQLAGLTMIMKKRFSRRNWPFTLVWAADGTQQASYTMTATLAERWRQAAGQLDAEQSDQMDDAPTDSHQGDVAVLELVANQVDDSESE